MPKQLVKIQFNPVVARVYEPDLKLKGLISEMLSYKVADAGRSGSVWSGISSLYRMKTGTFPAGFVRFVMKRLQAAGYDVRLYFKPAPKPIGPEFPVVDSFPNDPRYDYQMEVVNRLLAMNRMIAQVATGGGKSRIYKLCEQRIGLPSLFLTTRKSLMYQMADNYEASFGIKAGILGDGVWDPRPDRANFAIVDTISSRLEACSIEKEVEKEMERWNLKVEKLIVDELKVRGLPIKSSLMRRLPKEVKAQIDAVRAEIERQNRINPKALEVKIQKKVESQSQREPETRELLEKIGFLCLEEAHEVSSDGYYMIANACKNAHYRLALTATPFMKDDEEANMRLMAVTGPIGIRVTEKRLIDSGILAKPHFKYVKTPQPAKLQRGTSWPQAYKLGIMENGPRNKAIVDECLTAKSYGLTSMILVQRKDHGDKLKQLLMLNGLRTVFIYGKDDQKSRIHALKRLESGEIDVLIGSTILDVGVDVPSVGLIVLAGGGKAEVNLRQRIGRGLRAKKTGPNVAFVLDFEDRFNNHLVSHYRMRRAAVESTEGFAENIVREFDYEGLGFKKL